MPKYLYTGKSLFINRDFNIRVKPNEIVETRYVLPYSWTDFQLIDLNTPEPILPYTEQYTVNELTEVDLTDYDTVVVLLKNSDTATLNIHLYSPNANPILLDNFVNYWVGRTKSLYRYFEKIYLNPNSGIPEVIIYKGVIGSEYGGLESITGSGSGGCVMETTDPVPEKHGGLEAGTDINGMTACQVLNLILFPYQYPSFTSFYIEGQSTVLEVGDVITGGVRTFRWSTSHNENIQPNTITIRDVTSGTTLISNTNNDGTENLDIGSDKTRNTAGSYSWQISALNTKGNTFSRNFTVNWRYRKYWGYSDKETLNENDVKNLQNSSLANSYAGTYNFTNPGNAVYYYVVYPDVWGDYSEYKDVDTGFAVDAENIGTVDVTNNYGVTITYRMIRTTYLQNGDLKAQMS